MSESPYKKALVIGDGSWGTTLALLLARRGVDTTLWSPFLDHTRDLRAKRENERFLPGVPLPENMSFNADAHAAADGVELVVSVVPTQYLRGVIERFEDAFSGTTPIVSATKGLEVETLQRPTQILQEVLGERDICVLTGPSHAEEVAAGKPASVVVAGKDADTARAIQETFNSDAFRVYTHGDPVGAELAAALKNVIAIAAGISDGLELGDNAKSALVTRGVVELARYGHALGGKTETFFGLAGIGDLVTTCFSRHSRNRSVGEQIGAGNTLEQVLGKMNMVAEGVWTTKALFGPEAESGDAGMPIAEQVHAVLFENKNPAEAVRDLMRREPVEEMQGLL